jgi:thiol-disulfide isomerase/thioredoxin
MALPVNPGSDVQKISNQQYMPATTATIAFTLATLAVLVVLGFYLVRRQREAFQSRPLLKAYLASWCRFCQDFKPVWKQLPERLAAEGLEVGTVELDADRDAEAIRAAGVKSFPTIRFVDAQGTDSEYTGERTPEAIVAFVKEKLQAS